MELDKVLGLAKELTARRDMAADIEEGDDIVCDVCISTKDAQNIAAAIRALVEYIAAKEEHEREVARGECGASDRFDTWVPLQKAYHKLKTLNDGLEV